MNEVKHIHLGRQQFTVSADAYGELKSYLAAITTQAGETGADVAEEVEIRMAELLATRGVSPESVVLPKDVAFLKSQLGEPSDFGDDTPATDPATVQPDSTRRLFRDTDDAMVAGVASGLAKYFGIDAVIVRIVFIALVFAGGSGVLVYALLWLLVPEAKTNSERLQMNGLAVNVNNLKRALTDADVSGATQRVSRSVATATTRIGRVVLVLIGIMFIFIGVAIFSAAIVGLVYMLTQGLQVAGRTLFPVDAAQTVELICGAVIGAIVAGVSVATGIALVRQRRIMPAWVAGAIVGVFVVAVSVGTGLGAKSAPSIRDNYLHLQHSHQVPVAPFSQVQYLGESSYVDMEQSAGYGVDIRTLGSVDISGIKLIDQGGILTIDTTRFHPERCDTVCPYGPWNTRIVVQTPPTVGQDQGEPTPPVGKAL